MSDDRCFDFDGVRVRGNPDRMTPQARDALRQLIALAQTATTCRHCGHFGLPGADHTCPCPYPDEDCPDHPLAEEAS